MTSFTFQLNIFYVKMLTTTLFLLLTVVIPNLVVADKYSKPEGPELPCADIKRCEIEYHLSTKTPYRVVANLNDKPINFPGCHPIRIWSVIRHGARYPSKEVIEAAHSTLMKLKKEMLLNPKLKICSEELERLKYWRFNVSTKEEKFLVAEGEDELIELAERMQNRFPNLLPDVYDESQFYFKYTATQRTLKSANSFATGLFGRHRIRDIQYPTALHRDPVLRFYKLCDRWKVDVDKNPAIYDNVNKFLQGSEMENAINFIKRKMQLKTITTEDVRLIYTICAFETAWERRKAPSVWCNFFNPETIKALEFAEDLEYYWNDGYGYDITYKIACPAIIDLFKFINPNSNKPNATFYFTHSGTLLKMLAHLGLYKDDKPLTYKDFNKKRLWCTSSIDAFATNLAFVLYECENSEPMVLTLHQERPVRIPGCPTKGNELCSLKTLQKLFASSLENSDFQNICKIER